ncbi:hypothetical protein BLNAU_13803 [Blattamonas nauphoetae]|uniref:Tc1-like transposase DDE domain-containing protein n=1 Tax=Blattamonas nauphoetae TaxID=2049346 RepID=A0ABQ9XFD7_9EUKA|nr:hypothetical protein BLNAU_13803 [Blattamonas nauphoetae]
MNVDVKAEIVRLFAEQEGHDGANRTEMICRFHSQHDFRAKDVIEALHIPRSTFYDGMKTLRKGYTPGKRGSHSKLRDAEDSLLKNWVDERCRAGRLPTPNDVTTQANSILIEHNQNENPPPQLSRTVPNLSFDHGATIVFLVAADGDATLKSVILPTVNTPPDLIIPAITNKRKISANPLTHALLLLDGAPYHKHAEVLRAAKDNLIDIPVDQSINATFRNVISQTIPDHLAVAAADHRQSFMQTFLRATDSALSTAPFSIHFHRVPDTIPDNVHLQPNQQHLLTPDLNSLFHPASDDLDDLFLPGRIPHA